MRATYRLTQQTSRWCRFAVATVEVVPAVEHTVTVAEHVDGHEARRAEAVAGAYSALSRLASHGGGYRVTVTDVRATDADTAVGDVHEAAARAVGQALNVARAYVGFSEPESDAANLLHAWLHFDGRPPTQLHGRGDELLLCTDDPYPGYGMGDAGEVRVGPAAAPDLLADVVGRRLTDAAVILGSPASSCAGLRLRLETTEVVIGTFCDEWVLTNGQPPAWLEPYWSAQPWILHG